jgi:hypothetical protein
MTGPRDNQRTLGQSNTNKQSNSTDVTIEGATVNVFFDGTRNNYYNTDVRKRGGAMPAQDNDSYFNDYTNIAWLFTTAVSDINVYVEGMGTSRSQKDDSQGYAYGAGATGVTERARRAFDQIVMSVRGVRKGKNPDYLILNVFGFSRGAATARHFIHLTKTEPQRFTGWGLNKSTALINFVGLYDTVASYSDSSWNPTPNFTNDTSELHLDFGTDYAAKVFHLVAKDEFRVNFSLTNIASAGSIGFEMTIPGAHSDIGGSYVDGAIETVMIEIDKVFFLKYLINNGWYKESQTLGGKPSYFIAERKVSNQYFKVGLSIMEAMIKIYARSLTFKGALPLRASGQVESVRTQFVAEAKVNRHKTHYHASLPFDGILEKAFYNEYLHMSSTYEKTYIGPAYTVAFRPNLEGATPKRIKRGG